MFRLFKSKEEQPKPPNGDIPENAKSTVEKIRKENDEKNQEIRRENILKAIKKIIFDKDKDSDVKDKVRRLGITLGALNVDIKREVINELAQKSSETLELVSISFDTENNPVITLQSKKSEKQPDPETTSEKSTGIKKGDFTLESINDTAGALTADEITTLDHMLTEVTESKKPVTQTTTETDSKKNTNIGDITKDNFEKIIGNLSDTSDISVDKKTEEKSSVEVANSFHSNAQEIGTADDNKSGDVEENTEHRKTVKYKKIRKQIPIKSGEIFASVAFEDGTYGVVILDELDQIREVLEQGITKGNKADTQAQQKAGVEKKVPKKGVDNSEVVNHDKDKEPKKQGIEIEEKVKSIRKVLESTVDDLIADKLGISVEEVPEYVSNYYGFFELIDPIKRLIDGYLEKVRDNTIQHNALEVFKSEVRKVVEAEFKDEWIEKYGKTIKSVETGVDTNSGRLTDNSVTDSDENTDDFEFENVRPNLIGKKYVNEVTGLTYQLSKHGKKYHVFEISEIGEQVQITAQSLSKAIAIQLAKEKADLPAETKTANYAPETKIPASKNTENVKAEAVEKEQKKLRAELQEKISQVCKEYIQALPLYTEGDESTQKQLMSIYDSALHYFQNFEKDIEGYINQSEDERDIEAFLNKIKEKFLLATKYSIGYLETQVQKEKTDQQSDISAENSKATHTNSDEDIQEPGNTEINESDNQLKPEAVELSLDGYKEKLLEIGNSVASSVFNEYVDNYSDEKKKVIWEAFQKQIKYSLVRLISQYIQDRFSKGRQEIDFLLFKDQVERLSSEVVKDVIQNPTQAGIEAIFRELADKDNQIDSVQQRLIQNLYKYYGVKYTNGMTVDEAVQQAKINSKGYPLPSDTEQADANSQPDNGNESENSNTDTTKNQENVITETELRQRAALEIHTILEKLNAPETIDLGRVFDTFLEEHITADFLNKPNALEELRNTFYDVVRTALGEDALNQLLKKDSAQTQGTDDKDNKEEASQKKKTKEELAEENKVLDVYFDLMLDRLQMQLQRGAKVVEATKMNKVKETTKQYGGLAVKSAWQATKFTMILGTATRAITSLAGPLGAAGQVLLRGVYGGVGALIDRSGGAKALLEKQKKQQATLKELYARFDTSGTKTVDLRNSLKKELEYLFTNDLNTDTKFVQQLAMVEAVDFDENRTYTIGVGEQARQRNAHEVMCGLYETSRDLLRLTKGSKEYEVLKKKQELYYQTAVDNQLFDALFTTIATDQAEKAMQAYKEAHTEDEASEKVDDESLEKIMRMQAHVFVTSELNALQLAVLSGRESASAKATNWQARLTELQRTSNLGKLATFGVGFAQGALTAVRNDIPEAAALYTAVKALRHELTAELAREKYVAEMQKPTEYLQRLRGIINSDSADFDLVQTELARARGFIAESSVPEANKREFLRSLDIMEKNYRRKVALEQAQNMFDIEVSKVSERLQSLAQKFEQSAIATKADASRQLSVSIKNLTGKKALKIMAKAASSAGIAYGTSILVGSAVGDLANDLVDSAMVSAGVTIDPEAAALHITKDNPRLQELEKLQAELSETSWGLAGTGADADDVLNILEDYGEKIGLTDTEAKHMIAKYGIEGADGNLDETKTMEHLVEEGILAESNGTYVIAEDMQKNMAIEGLRQLDGNTTDIERLDEFISSNNLDTADLQKYIIEKVGDDGLKNPQTLQEKISNTSLSDKDELILEKLDAVERLPVGGSPEDRSIIAKGVLPGVVAGDGLSKDELVTVWVVGENDSASAGELGACDTIQEAYRQEYKIIENTIISHPFEALTENDISMLPQELQNKVADYEDYIINPDGSYDSGPGTFEDFEKLKVEIQQGFRTAMADSATRDAFVESSIMSSDAPEHEAMKAFLEAKAEYQGMSEFEKIELIKDLNNLKEYLYKNINDKNKTNPTNDTQSNRLSFSDIIQTEKGSKTHDSIWRSTREIVKANLSAFGYEGDTQDQASVQHFAELTTARLIADMDDVKDLVHDGDQVIVAKGNDGKWHVELKEAILGSAGYLNDTLVTKHPDTLAVPGAGLGEGVVRSEVTSPYGDKGIAYDLPSGRHIEVWDWDRDGRFDIVENGTHTEIEANTLREYLTKAGVFTSTIGQGSSEELELRPIKEPEIDTLHDKSKRFGVFLNRNETLALKAMDRLENKDFSINERTQARNVFTNAVNNDYGNMMQYDDIRETYHNIMNEDFNREIQKGGKVLGIFGSGRDGERLWNAFDKLARMDTGLESGETAVLARWLADGPPQDLNKNDLAKYNLLEGNNLATMQLPQVLETVKNTATENSAKGELPTDKHWQPYTLEIDGEKKVGLIRKDGNGYEYVHTGQPTPKQVVDVDVMQVMLK